MRDAYKLLKFFMKAVRIVESQKEIWNKFIAENNSESFLQSWEWGNFQESLGHKIWRIGITENGLSSEDETNKSQITNYKLQTNTKYQIPNTKYNLIAVALIIKHNLPFGKSYLYCPRGPAMINSKSQILNKFQIPNSKLLLNFLFEEIGKIAKKEKSLFLRIDPPISWNLELRTWNLEYNWIFKKSPSEIQPRDTLILDLTKSEEEILREMKQKTRYNIRLAERKKLEIRSWEVGKLGKERNWKLEVGKLGNLPDKKSPPYNKGGQGWLKCRNQESFKKDFEEFWKLIEETSRRDGFKSHGKGYYWKMLEGLDNDNGLVEGCHSELVSESVNDEGLPRFQFVKQSIRRIGKAGGYRRKIPELNSGQALKQVRDDNYSCSKILRAKLYLAEYESKIIAANIVLYFGDLAVYLHGTSSNEYRNTMAPYLLQWRQILDAKRAGCKDYDFWGIEESSKFKVQSSKLRKKNWSGITRFKKGFGGYEKNYIGAYDLVFDNIGYAIYGFFKKFKKINLISN